MDTIKIFVYGTLKIGGLFSDEFNKFRLDVKPAILNEYLMFDFGKFPGIVHSKGSISKVYGELHTYSEPKNVLELMDYIEGYYPDNKGASLFLRKPVKVLSEAEKVKAYTYVFASFSATRSFKLIKDGIWKKEDENMV